MNPNLRDFIRAAKDAGPAYYVEVTRPLDSYLVVGIIQHKLAAQGRNPVIYCPEIKGSQIPLVTNLFGSFDTLALGFGCNLEKMTRAEVYDVVRKRTGHQITPAWVPASEAPVKQVKLLHHDVDLDLLPIIHNSKLDAGKYIGAGFMIAKWPDTGRPNSFYKDYRAKEAHIFCSTVKKRGEQTSEEGDAWEAVSALSLADARKILQDNLKKAAKDLKPYLEMQLKAIDYLDEQAK